MEFWERFEIWCCEKHFLKAEVNAKETLEKAYREQDKFTPEGGTMRNFLTAVGNIEAAVGHFEEFATKYHTKVKKAENEEDRKELMKEYKFYREMTDSTRLVRQEMIKSPGHPPEKFLESLDMLETLMDKLIDFMKGKPIESIINIEEEKDE